MMRRRATIEFYRLLASKKFTSSRWLGPSLVGDRARPPREDDKIRREIPVRPNYRFFTEAGARKFAEAQASANVAGVTTSTAFPAKSKP